MDRIKLYEAATGTEAMNEIKAACSNMRNCIRKYAGGKANTNAKNEMLEGMKKIEADLKAIVKSGAKTSKKVNESFINESLEDDARECVAAYFDPEIYPDIDPDEYVEALLELDPDEWDDWCMNMAADLDATGMMNEYF